MSDGRVAVDEFDEIHSTGPDRDGRADAHAPVVAFHPTIAAPNVPADATAARTAFTNAVVAIKVLLSLVAGVGAFGLPVNVGDASNAYCANVVRSTFNARPA